MRITRTQQNWRRFCVEPAISKHSKSQSAMEYLMTYGWAILIIAVVLIALFQLGVFNGSNLAPKAQSGSCEVFKSSAGASLAGACNNDLPQYVPVFSTPNSYISIQNTPAMSNPSVFTVTFWTYIDAQQNSGGYGARIFNSGEGGASDGYEIYTGSGSLGSSASISAALGFSSGSEAWWDGSVSTGAWQFIALTFNSTSGNSILYFSNSGSLSTGVMTFTPGKTLGSWSSVECIGGYQCSAGGDDFNGMIANVQFYNASLSANDVTALYQEGIGGHPIDTQNLVGWWPLNGNANDYSGNNNDGTATSVAYTGSWTSGYSAP